MSAEFELQKALVAALKADAATAALVGGRIFDRVPAGAPRPYLHLRQIESVEDGADCIEGLEIFVEIDVWSDAVGKPEAARVTAAVRAALHLADLPLAGFDLVELRWRSTNLVEAEPLLTRGRMSFVAFVDAL